MDQESIHKEKEAYKRVELQTEQPTRTQQLKKLDLTCAVCKNEIDSANININSTLAKCNHCGSLLFLDDEEFFGRRKRNRPEMMIPEGTEVLHLPSSLDIRTKWNRGKAGGAGMWFMVFFTVLWNAMLWPVAFSSIAAGSILSVLPMAAHLAVGLGLIYYLMTIFFNHTDIYVTDTEITMSSAPLKNPFKKDIVIPTKNINQLYVSRYVSSTTNGAPNHAYALYAITNTNKRISLLRGMNKETQLYIEQEIEHFLKIDDEKVIGEVG